MNAPLIHVVMEQHVMKEWPRSAVSVHLATVDQHAIMVCCYITAFIWG